MNEAKKQIGPTAQASKTAVDEAAQLLPVGRRKVGQVAFDVAMTILFGVEFGSVLGQRLNADFRVLEEVAQRGVAGMNAGMITYQDEAFRHKPAQVLQGGDDILAVHAACKMPFVNLARQGQPDGRCEHPPVLGHPPQDRPLALRRPGAPERLQK